MFPKLTVILEVFWPEVIVAPLGTIQLYVTPGTVAQVYTTPVFPHKPELSPVIEVGVNTVEVMATFATVGLLPQELLAFTDKTPVVKPEGNVKFAVVLLPVKVDGVMPPVAVQV